MRNRRFVRINADDFGFSTGVNQAIVTAHQKGVLTSTSLMITGDAVEDAIELAKANPTLSVGLHLVLGMGRSVLSPEQIPHLVDASGRFPDDPAKAGLNYQFNAKARRELPLEIRAQLEKFRQTGLKLSHVDGHLHLHSHPIVLKHLVEFAKEFEIPEIRLPSEELSIAIAIDPSDRVAKTVGSIVFAGLRRYGETLLRKHRIHFADRVYGLLQTGRITESYLLDLIPRITANVVEIYSHPAIVVPGEPSNAPLNLGFAELEALLSDRVRAALEQHGFELVGSIG
ncbi:hopanoid biosynthesis-associated protein HpnK [Pseudanabaenaceae cyanobacterium LEGE 13415]|nr:hopanoid biosynthesis-associated protein HpnK [Pseudanabaenaceae cyanobacterium LEGE 13415]